MSEHDVMTAAEVAAALRTDSVDLHLRLHELQMRFAFPAPRVDAAAAVAVWNRREIETLLTRRGTVDAIRSFCRKPPMPCVLRSPHAVTT